MSVQPPKPRFIPAPIGDGRRPPRPVPTYAAPSRPATVRPKPSSPLTAAPLPASSRLQLDLTERGKLVADCQAIIKAFAEGDTPTVRVLPDLLGDLRSWMDDAVSRRQLTLAQSLEIVIRLLPPPLPEKVVDLDAESPLTDEQIVDAVYGKSPDNNPVTCGECVGKTVPAAQKSPDVSAIVPPASSGTVPSFEDQD